MLGTFIARFPFRWSVFNSSSKKCSATAVFPAPPMPINAHKPNLFCGVPTLYAALIAHLESGKGQLETQLRRCISAGEALPEEVGKNWQKLSGAEILDGVGSTEMLHIFLSNAPGDVVYGTSGRAVPGYEIRLVN